MIAPTRHLPSLPSVPILLAAIGICLVGLAACSGDAAPATPGPSEPRPAISSAAQETVIYQVTQRLALVNYGDGRPDKQNLWIALISDFAPYQKVLSAQIRPDDYQLIIDEYGNRYAEFDLSGMRPGRREQIELRYQVAVEGQRLDLGECQGEIPAGLERYLLPELHIESNNPQIMALAEKLSAGQETACDQAWAFYDYVSRNLIYTYNGASWGAQAALGEMGADCTEFSSLMIALSRAAGLPARYLEGLYFIENQENALARTEHAWLEVYLPGVGWAPMDPTVGRSPFEKNKRFAAMPADHIVVTLGRNPSTLRGGSYWTHLYWPGNSTTIRVEDEGWEIRALP